MSYNGCHKNEWGRIVPDDTDDGIFGRIGLYIVAAFVLFVVFAGFYASSMWYCEANARQMGFECNYSIITGCKIKLENGHYVDIDKYRGGLD